MNERLEVIERGGYKILSVNMSGQSIPEIIEMFPQMNAVAIPNKIRLFVLNIEKTHSNSDLKEASKQSISELEASVGKVYSALIGIRGIQKIIANAINRDQYFANDADDAIDWLLKRIKEEE
jgi:hypothetical protein